MIEKRLGKIDFVEFGSMKDYPFQLGLQLGFSMSGSGVMDGGKYTVNMSPDCHAIMTILEMDEEKGMETPDPNAASMAIGACSARSDIRAGLR